MRLVENLGSTMVYIFSYVVALLLLPLLTLFRRYSGHLNKLQLVLSKHLIWNGVISLIIKQYPPILLSCGINLYRLDFHRSASFSSVMTLLLVLGSLASFLIIWRIIKNRGQGIEQQGEQEFKAKYGVLFEKLHAQKILSSYWNLL
jgi:uncharacterized membrane protein